MHAAWDAEAYAASFARLCAGTIAPLIKGLGPSLDGEEFLDVGCGPGDLAAAARRAGYGVVGIDPDRSMVELARRRHPSLGFVQGALPRLPVPNGAFDRVGANFAVNHADDPRAAVRELVRVTTPSGRLGVTIWPNVISPVNQLWNDVLEAAGVRDPARSLPAEKDFVRTASGLAQLMSRSGLESVTAEEVSWTFRIAPDDLWRGAEGGIASIGATYLTQDTSTRDAMHAAYRHLTERSGAGLLKFPSTAVLAIGTRPGSHHPQQTHLHGKERPWPTTSATPRRSPSSPEPQAASVAPPPSPSPPRALR